MSTKPCNPKDAIALDKLPMHLVSPVIRAYQSIAHFLGNVKYGAHNYRVAQSRASVYFSALQRHQDAWWEGQKYDPVDGTPHLANAQACLNILIEAEEAGLLIDDRPPSREGVLMRLKAEFEALMPKIRQKYAGKNPHHYTIADTVGAVQPPEPTVETIEPLPMIERRRSPRPEDADLLREAAQALNDFGVTLQGDDAAPNAATYKTWTPERCWDLKRRLRDAAGPA